MNDAECAINLARQFLVRFDFKRATWNSHDCELTMYTRSGEAMEYQEFMSKPLSLTRFVWLEIRNLFINHVFDDVIIGHDGKIKS